MTWRRAMSKESMKKSEKDREAGPIDLDEILPEYDFSHARPNKYTSRYAAGSIVVVLDPDVAAVFPTAADAQ